MLLPPLPPPPLPLPPPLPPSPTAAAATADRDLDIYNNGAKHLLKSAGTTKEERGSFDAWMEEGVVADAFRRLHPDARGAYTYWSMRTNAVRLHMHLSE